MKDGSFCVNKVRVSSDDVCQQCGQFHSIVEAVARAYETDASRLIGK
jgi:hypothetical protein